LEVREGGFFSIPEMAQCANRQVSEGHGTTSYFGSIPKPTKEVTIDFSDTLDFVSTPL
jgi:hypothetical protein